MAQGTNTKLGLVFPGQGSQSPGMLKELATVNPIIEKTFTQASEVLGLDLWAKSCDSDLAELSQTELTQPLLLTAGVAMWQLWQEKNGSQPALMAGHSLGEFTALVCAGALDFADALLLVQARGRWMQEAVPADEGSMVAVIGMEQKLIEDCCRQATAEQVVVIANINAPEQIVISGHRDAVTRASALCSEQGARRCITLPVSAPFHSPLMKSAQDNLEAYLTDINISDPNPLVVHNVTAMPEASSANIRKLLVTQTTASVRWVETIQYMAAQGIKYIVECGPGKVLSSTVKRIDSGLKGFATDSLDNLSQALEVSS